MYIHSYQIHNVLNVYRKQLSQMPSTRTQKQVPTSPNGERVAISRNGQRQSIIDQVSAEIVDRIAQAGPLKSFGETLTEQLTRSDGRATLRPSKKEAEFTYSSIDENNNKVTNTLPVENFSPLTGEAIDNAQNVSD